MAPSRQVVLLAEQPIRAPRDRVRDARLDLEAATGAHIRLDGVRGGERLHVPQTVALGLGVLDAEERAGDVELRHLLRTAPASWAVGAGHTQELTSPRCRSAR